jgi:hypothetical protein
MGLNRPKRFDHQGVKPIGAASSRGGRLALATSLWLVLWLGKLAESEKFRGLAEVVAL